MKLVSGGNLLKYSDHSCDVNIKGWEKDGASKFLMVVGGPKCLERSVQTQQSSQRPNVRPKLSSPFGEAFATQQDEQSPQNNREIENPSYGSSQRCQTCGSSFTREERHHPEGNDAEEDGGTGERASGANAAVNITTSGDLLGLKTRGSSGRC